MAPGICGLPVKQSRRSFTYSIPFYTTPVIFPLYLLNTWFTFRLPARQEKGKEEVAQV
jgi:hypothetical protein